MTAQVEQPRGEEGNESFQSSQGVSGQKAIQKRSLLSSAHRKGPDQESIFSFSRSPDRVMQTVDWELSEDAVSVPTLAQNQTESEDPCRQGTTLKSASPSLDFRGQTFIPPCPFLNEHTKTNQQYRKALYVKKIKSLREERENSKPPQPQEGNWQSQQVKSIKRSPSDKVKMTIKFLTQQTPVAKQMESLDDLNSTSPSAKEKIQSKITRALSSESKTPPPLSRNPLSKCGTSSFNLSNSSTRKYQHNFKPEFSAAFQVQVQQSPSSPEPNQQPEKWKLRVREKERRIRELENEVQEIKAKVDDIQNESNRSTELYKSHYKKIKKERNEIEREKRDISTVQLQLKNTQKCARDLVSVLVQILELILVKKSLLNSTTSLLEQSQISKELVVHIQHMIVRKLQEFGHSPVGIDLTQRLNEIRSIENVLRGQDFFQSEPDHSNTSSPIRREETEEYENFLNFQAVQQAQQRPKLHRTGSLQLGKTLSAFLSKNNKEQPPPELSYKNRVVEHVKMRIVNCNVAPQDLRREVVLNQQQTQTSSTGSQVPSWSSSSGFSYAKNLLANKRIQSTKNATQNGEQYFPRKQKSHRRETSAVTDSAYLNEERKSRLNEPNSEPSRRNDHQPPQQRDNNFPTDSSLMSTIRALTSELQKLEDRDPDEMIIASARRKEGTDELQHYLHRDPSLQMSDTFFANIKEAASNVELGPKFEVSKEQEEEKGPEGRILAIALHTFKGQEECDLAFEKGEEVEIVEWRSENQWCYGRIGSREGWLPKNYISLK